MTSSYDLVYLAMRRWDSIQQRPQLLARGLSRHFRVLYVDPVVYSLPGYIRSHLRGDHSRNLGLVVRTVEDNLTILTPPALFPLTQESAAINRINHRLLARLVRRCMGQLSMAHPILWTSYPTHVPVVGTLDEALVCYDCMDNHAAFFPTGTARARLVTHLETEMLRRTDLVITTAQPLLERLATLHDCVYLVRNAVGEEFLSHADGPETSPPLDWPPGSGPVIGYMGTISHWLDYDAIGQLASRHPDWRFVFVGPQRVDIASTAALTNVHFLGTKPYDILPSYVARFDVGLIPFRLNELTQGVNPVKLYEYFAMGKPVVATRLPELIPHEELCYLAGNTEEFIQQVELAVNSLTNIAKVHQAAVQRREIARQNTWRTRTAQVGNLLESHLAAQAEL